MPRFQIDRRTMLGSATAAAALPLVSSTPTAAGDITSSVRALHRFHIGSMKVTVIDDARVTMPAPFFAMNQPEGSAGKFLQGFGLPAEFINIHLQTTLIESGPHKVLLDTGMGDVTFPGNEADNGRMAASLAAIGVSPDAITAVVISHGHPDHIGGCSMNGVPCFKNAAYYIPPSELEFWTQQPGSEQNFPNFMLGVGNAKLSPLSGLIRPYGDGDEIIPGLAAIAAPGHTLGHHAFLISDGGAMLLHLMDAAVHYLIGPEQPDWALAVEMDAAAAADTRRRLFSEAALKRMLVAGYHFPFPGIGRIVEQGPSWRFVPMQTA